VTDYRRELAKAAHPAGTGRCDATPIPVSEGSERRALICGCGFRTPLCSDRRTARQALDQHRQETTR